MKEEQSFEEQFPEIKPWMFEQGISTDIIGTYNEMKSMIKKHCLSKQRVKEAIEKATIFTSVDKDILLKELKL